MPSFAKHAGHFAPCYLCGECSAHTTDISHPVNIEFASGLLADHFRICAGCGAAIARVAASTTHVVEERGRDRPRPPIRRAALRR